MSGDIQAKVYAWIDKTADDGAEPRCVRLQLSHLNAAEQLQTLSTWVLEGAELADIKSELWSTAKHVVASWSHGLQRFAIRAFFADQDAAGAYFPFSLAGDPSEAGASGEDLGVTEPANLIGLQKQLMRHLEAKDKAIAGMALEMMTFQMRQVRASAHEAEQMRTRYHQLLERSEAVLMQAEERALVREMITRGEERKDQLAAKAMNALPVLANQVSQKLGGPQLFAGASPMQEQVLASLLASLDDQRFELLLRAFPDPAHQAYLLESYKRLVIEPKKGGAPGASEDPNSPRH